MEVGSKIIIKKGLKNGKIVGKKETKEKTLYYVRFNKQIFVYTENQINDF